jgi:hypothetical protein
LPGRQSGCGVLKEVMTIAGACITVSLLGSAHDAPAAAQRRTRTRFNMVLLLFPEPSLY